MASATTGTRPRQRVPASERRDALIEAAVHEFALGGLHGTPVDRIARRVGVAQPYVFSLFASKKELFLAAVERGFDLVKGTFTRVAAEFDPDIAAEDEDVLRAMGHSYVELLHSHRDYLMLQHQSFAACNDPEIRDRVRALYAGLVTHVERIAAEAAQRHGEPEPTSDRVDEFFRHGMWLNVAAAMGVEDLSAGCEWVRAEGDK
ncbi:MAG TPA: TetR/AcrR family transcriptional regulator [Solirubrobacteraceae bacterium]|jgi:AcrR family transcriptional regulator|nr:TetR/AcrR family transcriptional regulator [Solirubrobacteraceae bacterium]